MDACRWEKWRTLLLQSTQLLRGTINITKNWNKCHAFNTVSSKTSVSSLVRKSLDTRHWLASTATYPHNYISSLPTSMSGLIHIHVCGLYTVHTHHSNSKLKFIAFSHITWKLTPCLHCYILSRVPVLLFQFSEWQKKSTQQF